MLNQHCKINRREFVASQAVLISAAGLGYPGVGYSCRQFAAGALLPGKLADNRSLDLLALHTMESLCVPFWQAGDYLPNNLSRFNHVLRDHRTHEVHAIDPRLLEFLFELSQALELNVPLHVISGYRSPATNAKLRLTSNGVAKRSLHMVGRAIDIRVPEVPSSVVRDTAMSLRRGGVGYYPRADFVHLDTGRVRGW